MPVPLDLRKKPISVKVQVTTGEGVEITWSDGHTSRYEFAYLREHCPCAVCNDERARKEKLSDAAKAAALPMFKPRVTAKAAKSVGNYAIHIEFSDGHSTGIYSYEYLREICVCEACGRESRSAEKETNSS